MSEPTERWLTHGNAAGPGTSSAPRLDPERLNERVEPIRRRILANDGHERMETDTLWAGLGICRRILITRPQGALLYGESAVFPPSLRHASVAGTNRWQGKGMRAWCGEAGSLPKQLS